MFEIMINGENVSVFQALLLAFLGLRGFGSGGSSNNNNNKNNNKNNNNNNMRRKKRSSALPDFMIESIMKFLVNYYVK